MTGSQECLAVSAAPAWLDTFSCPKGGLDHLLGSTSTSTLHAQARGVHLQCTNRSHARQLGWNSRRQISSVAAPKASMELSARTWCYTEASVRQEFRGRVAEPVAPSQPRKDLQVGSAST